MNNYTIYCDGSCKGNGQENAVGGWAYVILDGNGDQYACDSNFEKNSTNNRMELTAAIKALEYINTYGMDPMECEIFTDSTYIHNCYTQKWYRKWQSIGWINSAKEPVKNKELWERIIPYFENTNFTFYKVKGHADNFYNNMVDKLAVKAAEKGK